MADTVEVTPSSSPVVDDSMDQSPSPDASPSPSSDAAMQESENEHEADEEGDEPSGGRWGKKNTKPKVPLPVYTPLWSPVAHLSSTRRSLSDVALAPRRTEHLIQEGDTVIAYESRVSMSPLVIKKGQVYGNRFGSFHHSDMIGLPLGSRVSARGKSKGWIALLPFAPDLWTLSLTHRTQILYQADISYILFQLDLKPGDVVFESGTGSGSLTTALATTVKPHGHVHTFEFNADRVKKAKIDFANNHLSDVITVRQRDVVNTGFPLVEGGCNAVFLDLPAPWCVLESARAALKHQARLCSFSPCIEQVQRVCVKLDELGFSEIVTVEILLRSFEVQSHAYPAPKPQPRSEIYWGKARSDAAAAAAAPSTTEADATAASRKRSLEESTDAASEPAEKKLKTEDGTAPSASETVKTEPVTVAAAAPTTPASSSIPSKSTPPLTLVTAKPYQLMRGHTGYLTFAVCNKY